jgi:hypothetical protein
MAVLLVGCFPATEAPDCATKREALRVVVAYDRIFNAGLSGEDIACAMDFRIAFATDRETYKYCGAGRTACYTTSSRDRRDHVVVLYADAWWGDSTSGRLATLRHELSHHVLWCMEGDPDPGHQSEAFDSVYGFERLPLEASHVQAGDACDDMGILAD